MIAFTRAGSLALASLLIATAPLALRAQAASISMPKQAAQRAADASNRQLSTQMAQAQSAQQHGPTSAGGSPQRPGEGAGPQGTSGRTGVVQSGGARAPDPGGSRGAGPAPDPANTIMREVFEYAAEGRRDPFFSLMATGDLRPLLSDLRLTTILYDLSGRRPVAVMNDVSTNLQYRVTTGMMLGRMRVKEIRPRKVIFSIEEFGFSRADSLVLAEKTSTRQ